MKILLDPQIFDHQTYGGISKYYTEIFSILGHKKNVEVILPRYSSDNVYIQTTDLLVKNPKLLFFYKLLSFFKISSRTLRKKNSDQLLQKVFHENNYDVFVSTYYNPYFLNQINHKPFVLTVYDMIHEILPEYFTDDTFNVSKNKLIQLNTATKIIAVSNNTKKDILKIYPHINPDKIVVIHHGSSIKINPEITVALPKNYVLYVGARANYKNFKFLVNSMIPSFNEDPSLILIAAGGGEFSDEEIKFINGKNLSKQVIQRNFKDNELGHFYSQAQCFVFPSLYEGFGIPVLEAMACGCPIILSNRGSFPEVAEEAGIYFDTNSENDLTNKIKIVLNDADMRKQYVERGLQQVKKYNWENAAEQCLKVYEEAIMHRQNLEN